MKKMESLSLIPLCGHPACPMAFPSPQKGGCPQHKGGAFAQRGHNANCYVVYPRNTTENTDPPKTCTHKARYKQNHLRRYLQRPQFCGDLSSVGCQPLEQHALQKRPRREETMRAPTKISQVFCVFSFSARSMQHEITSSVTQKVYKMAFFLVCLDSGVPHKCSVRLTGTCWQSKCNIFVPCDLHFTCRL